LKVSPEHSRGCVGGGGRNRAPPGRGGGGARLAAALVGRMLLFMFLLYTVAIPAAPSVVAAPAGCFSSPVFLVLFF